MPIAANTRMLISVAAAVARVLAHEHVPVLPDTVSLVLWDVVPTVMGLRLCRCPGEVVSSDLNVIVCKFAQLVVVHTEQFCFLGGTEVETRDVVDGERNEGRHDEGVARTRDDVGNLDVKLLVVSIGPATSDNARVNAVETDDVGCAKESVGKEAKNTSDTVLSQDIHRVVDSDPVFNYMALLARYSITSSL